MTKLDSLKSWYESCLENIKYDNPFISEEECAKRAAPGAAAAFLNDGTYFTLDRLANNIKTLGIILRKCILEKKTR